MLKTEEQGLMSSQLYQLNTFTRDIFNLLRRKAIPLSTEKMDLIVSDSRERIFKEIEQEMKYRGRTNLGSILKKERKRIFDEYIAEDGELIYARIPPIGTILGWLLMLPIRLVMAPFRGFSLSPKTEVKQVKNVPLDEKYPPEFLEEPVVVRINQKKVKGYYSVWNPVLFILLFVVVAFPVLWAAASSFFFTEYLYLLILYGIFLLITYILTSMVKEKKNRPYIQIISSLTLLDGSVVPRRTVLTPPEVMDFTTYSNYLTRMVHKKQVEIRRAGL